MTKEELEAEVQFRLCKSVFATLHREGHISYEQLQALLCATAEKIKAPIGDLEVNSIAGEKGYTG